MATVDYRKVALYYATKVVELEEQVDIYRSAYELTMKDLAELKKKLNEKEESN